MAKSPGAEILASIFTGRPVRSYRDCRPYPTRRRDFAEVGHSRITARKERHNSQVRLKFTRRNQRPSHGPSVFLLS